MTSKSELQQANEQLKDKLREARNQVNAATVLANKLLHRHKPYVSKIDLSIIPVDRMADVLAERAAKNMFCTECRTRFPCRAVEDFRLLLGTLRDGIPVVLTDEEQGPKPGRLDVHL